MSQIRIVQKKGRGRYVLIPRDICDRLSITNGDYVHWHVLNERQIMLTKVEVDIPVIQLEEEEV